MIRHAVEGSGDHLGRSRTRTLRRLSAFVTVAMVLLATTPAGAQSRFFGLTPCRIADTRNPPELNAGPVLSAGTDRFFQITGLCGIPAGALAVAVTVTAVQPTGQGHLTLYPTDLVARPSTSTINFSGNDFATASGVIMPISGISGALNVFTFLAAGGGTVHLVLDVTGYFAP